jgi:putative sterol carrier protein
MAGVFPDQVWLQSLIDHLNTDEKYAKVAHKWEGDLMFEILPSGALKERTLIYLDLWHGKCRGGELVPAGEEREAAFVMKAPYDNFVKVLTGELDAMQAMLTRKLSVKGSMPYMMRNVPTVLEFVRCGQDVTEDFLTE